MKEKKTRKGVQEEEEPVSVTSSLNGDVHHSDEHDDSGIFGSKRKGKKGGKKAGNRGEDALNDMTDKLAAVSIGGEVPASKSKKKQAARSVTAEEDRGSDAADEDEENADVVRENIKGKKAGKLGMRAGFDLLGDDEEMEVEEEEDAGPATFSGKKKKGKKSSKQLPRGGFDALDNEEPTPISDEEVAVPAGKKKKDKKAAKQKARGGFSLLEDEEREGEILDEGHEEESHQASSSGKNDKRAFSPASRGGFDVLDDENGEGDDSQGEAQEEVGQHMAFSGKKKKKDKKASKKAPRGGIDILEDIEGEGEAEEEEDYQAVFSGKKKKKDKKESRQASHSGFDLLEDVEKSGEEEEAEEEEENQQVVLSGKEKKKSAKQATRGGFALLGEDGEEEDPQEDEDMIEADTLYSGKKGKISPAAVLEESAEDVLDDAEEDYKSAFSGKKKGKKDKKAQSVEAEAEEASLQAGPPLTATGKKGKKGKAAAVPSDIDDIDAIMAQLEAPKAASKPPGAAPETEAEVPSASADTGGKKKKGKKGAKAAATDDVDIDDLLAQLDGPTVAPPAQSAPSPSTVSAGVVAGDGEAASKEEGEEKEEGGKLSAAAKKKLKKKEKEKAKKEEKAMVEEGAEAKASDALAPAAGKAGGKGPKPSKAVREMQEALRKLEEAKDKARKEEEERMKKEEEEAARLAEEERLKEEAKQRRKEREKQKKEEAKKQGKYLTAKQKEEARRLEMIRQQILGQKVADSAKPSVDDGTEESAAAPAPPKRVMYAPKKKKGGPEAKGTQPAAAAGTAEVEATPPPEDTSTVGSADVAGDSPAAQLAEAVLSPPEADEAEPPQEEEEDDMDWDAKSWDSEAVVLPKKRGVDEEEEEEEVVSKKAAPAKSKPKPEEKPGATSVPPTPPAAAARLASEPAKGQTPALAAAEESSSEEEESEESSSESEEESDSDEEESSSEDEETKRKQEAKERREARRVEAMKNRSADDLRSPICCILGHVDTGKTKLLDKIRQTNVQEGEAGGITQQIGATYFPQDRIREKTQALKPDAELKVPGLLIIDTPGHESFTNLRSRGSGLCDIAILVIDIMHGLEPQTIESLNLLKLRKTPFVVALNKVDRLYDWKASPNAPMRTSLENQVPDVILEFRSRLEESITQLKMQGLNAALYWENPDPRSYVSLIPTSAHTGEGIPDMLLLLVELTQRRMEERLMFVSEVQCTVLEVKVVEGLGTTLDVILVNGMLREGDKIVVPGLQGPIVTHIRALLTPHPMKELRVKGTYQHHKELKAAQGIKICAQGMEHAVAGTQLQVVGPDDDVEELKDEAMKDMNSILSRVDKSGEGVCVQASTLGSLEALLEFLKSPEVNIPVSGIGIGPVHKKEVMRASVMLERRAKEFAVILAFDVKVTQEAREMAEGLGVRIFTADIIYHLFDQFTAYMGNVKEEKKKDAAESVVFPCVLRILPNCVFNKKDPIVLGVSVVEGILKVGTPICVKNQAGKGFVDLGRAASIEVNHKVVDYAKKGQDVALKIQGTNAEEQSRMFGRHFFMTDDLISRISRASIDSLKEHHKNELGREDWQLVIKLKQLLGIQ